MSAMGQELGSCEFLAIPFSVSLIVNFGPELHHGLGFVYGMALDVIYPPTSFPPHIPFFNASPPSKIPLQGEQCNIVPDNVDDIVADLAPEEKDEGTLFPFVASGNVNWHDLLGKQFANMF